MGDSGTPLLRRGTRAKKLTADFDLQVEGTQNVQSATFDIAFLGVDAFDISRSAIDLGDITETTNPASYDLYAFSATRGPHGTGPGDLAPPAVDIQMLPGVIGEPGPFVSVSPPVRVPDSQLAGFPELINRQKRPDRGRLPDDGHDHPAGG